MLCCLMLTCPGILEMPSKEHQIFFSITAECPQLQDQKILKSYSMAALVQEKAKNCFKKKNHLFELICNPPAAQYHFVAQNKE